MFRRAGPRIRSGCFEGDGRSLTYGRPREKVIFGENSELEQSRWLGACSYSCSSVSAFFLVSLGRCSSYFLDLFWVHLNF